MNYISDTLYKYYNLFFYYTYENKDISSNNLDISSNNLDISSNNLDENINYISKTVKNIINESIQYNKLNNNTKDIIDKIIDNYIDDKLNEIIKEIPFINNNDMKNYLDDKINLFIDEIVELIIDKLFKKNK